MQKYVKQSSADLLYHIGDLNLPVYTKRRKLWENIRPDEKLRCRVLHGARKDSNKGRAPGEV